jgi:CRISPR/Cas system CSM-associated protein Csm3 (group 7 of RAMP superfamily)
MDLDINVEWLITGPLHIGTGLARAGYADRVMRVGRDGRPYLSGEAVKGSIRGTAERLVRWLVPSAPRELKDRSTPNHAVLRRIFQPDALGTPYYRFGSATESGGAKAPATRAQTAIEPTTGSALNETLRVTEVWPSNALFKFHIRGFAGNWNEGRDRNDVLVLLAAVAATDSVAGRKGTGLGRITLRLLKTSVDGLDVAGLASVKMIERIQEHLLRELKEERDGSHAAEHHV